MRARHIAFAGIDGSGKSTQSQLLVGRLNATGWSAKLDTGKDDFAFDVLRATQGTGDWDEIRTVVGDHTMDLLGALQWARRRTTAAAMVQAGISVVSDRSDLCRIAMAGAAGRELPPHVRRVLGFGGRPDLTVWLDIDARRAEGRIARRGLDSEPFDRLLTTRTMYQAMSAKGDVCEVDGHGTPEMVAGRVWEVIRGRARDGLSGAGSGVRA